MNAPKDVTVYVKQAVNLAWSVCDKDHGTELCKKQQQNASFYL
jgi:hypothetical protein